jgi:O-antigen/teichoic acid export membrane protein
MTLNELLPRSKVQFRAVLNRLRNSAVAWSWVYNGLRLASGFILLPLVVRLLPTAELGMYYVLLSLSAIVPLVDFGFGPTIGRFVGYAVGGAETLQAHGVAPLQGTGTPNYRLLWELLFASQRLYRILTLLLLVILGAWGTWIVELRVHDTSSVALTRIAWVATLLAALFDIYSNWWVTYLRGLNEVTEAARMAVWAMVMRLGVPTVLLPCGVGLLSFPIGSFLGSLVQRHLARRRCLERLAKHAQPEAMDTAKYLQILWPNSWRLGLQLLSGYLTVNANTAICLYAFGLAANAQYGLSVQLLAFVSTMSAIWISVKWPLITQYRARQDLVAVQRVLRPRAWLLTATFFLGAAGLLVCGPPLLNWIGGEKQLLPLAWLSLMVVNAFFEGQFNLWGTLLWTENRLPYLWPTVATNVLSLLVTISLVHWTKLGIGALVLGPLLAGLLFNHWYWPPYAARSLGTTLLRLLFRGPIKTQPARANPLEPAPPAG